MGKIKTLSENIYRKIAAGEVVERPVSVVKELVENSLDAGATEIKIELENGGRNLIKISDNGSGFEQDDVEIAFKRHSTSKFSEFSDFDTLTTLGFRGEALPSILQVSQIELETSSDESGSGFRFSFKEGKIFEKKIIACKRGTSITVRELFSNFPVRKKFLKSDRSELNQIMALVEQIVLIKFRTSFELKHNGKVLFFYSGTESLRERVYQVFGKEFTDSLQDFNYSYENYIVSGLISKLNTGASSKKWQYYFVNGRSVREKTMYAAFNNTFSRFLEKSRSPVGIILVDIPPGEIDVNIHPMKLEIKFEDSSMVYQLIKRGIESAFVQEEDISIRVDFEKTGGESERYTDRSDDVNSNYSQQGGLFGEGYDNDEDDFKIIGQYKDSYIIVEKDSNLLVVDQHNADERANFEKLKESYNKKKVISVSPLFPLIIELSPSEIELYDDDKKEILENSGFIIENMGQNDFDIKKYPQILNERDVKDTIKAIIILGKDEVDFEDRVLAEIACKSSIKVNYKLYPDQMKKVVRELYKTNNPFFCPHKRPIIVDFSLESIEKALKRR
ncbi:MAG: DNA mismatch repair endonuclease MutL [Acidobacteriota bacterium]